MSSSEEDKDPINVGTSEVVTGLDPAGVYDSGSMALFSNVYQSLLTFTPSSQQPVPDAASHCDFRGEDLLVYVCELRPGLKFSNGHPLTAKDVKFSFDRIVAINDDQGPVSLLSTLDTVRTEGERQVVFHLRSPDATFPYKIASGAGAIVDHQEYPADKLRDDGKVDGSGPFTLSEYEIGEKAVLKPNDDYQGVGKGTGQPVTVHYFDSGDKLSTAWKKREVDVVANGLPPQMLAKLNPADPDIKVIKDAAPTTRSLVLDIRSGSPMVHKEVRQAVAAVLDREALVRRVHKRTVDPLYSLIPQGITGHTTPFYDDYPKVDTERARRLIQEAGLKTPIPFTLGFSEGETNIAEAKEVRRQLEASGLFKVTMARRDWKTFQTDFADHAFDAFTISWVADFPDPDTFTTPLVGPKPVFHNGYRSKQVHQLIQRTQRKAKRSETARDFRAIQEIVAQDVPLIPLWQQQQYLVSSNDISGTEYLSDGTGTWRLWGLDRI
ncbi:peptide-binding protein [Streptomyces palmae]|uniref:Peptide-binding protein n=2 Tax=Streptomyces palmae TaxID=1701085 RepID=A0A4Z0H7A8_9ACTN|nr:peptide-binding protein [Streptomyces palmae]